MSYKAYVIIMRPANVLMAGLAVLLVMLCMGFDMAALVYVVPVILTLAGGNVLNDYFDYEIDVINHPERPIPSGDVSKTSAVVMFSSLFSAAFIVAYFISTCALLIVAYAIFLLLLYESALKKEGLPGNVTISMLVAMIFIYSGVVMSSLVLTLPIAIMAFFANLAREVVKDVEDMMGDFDRHTLPKKVGRAAAFIYALGFILVAVVISPMPYMLGIYSFPYILIVAMADLIMVYGAVMSFSDASKGQKTIKIGMLVGIFSFAGGVLL